MTYIKVTCNTDKVSVCLKMLLKAWLKNNLYYIQFNFLYADTEVQILPGDFLKLTVNSMKIP